MARTKISEFSATPGDNTDIDGIDIAEGCAPSGINNAIRELMAQLKDMQTGASGDTFTLTTVNSTTMDTTNLEVTNLKAKDGTSAGSIANSTGVVTLASTVLTTTDINGGTIDGTTIGGTTPAAATFSSEIIDANTSSAALRITQVGAGNALLVEDSSNPDATPTVIAADGTVISGYTSSLGTGLGYRIQVAATDASAGYSAARYSANAGAPTIALGKSRSTDPATKTIVQSADNIGYIDFRGDDGAAFISAAQIQAAVDGTPGTNDMPGRLVFSTTADGASSPTEAMRINSLQRVVVAKSSVGTPSALSSSASSIAIDMASSNNFTHTFTENTTLANPTNLTAGQSGVIVFTQHASSPKTLAFGSYWDFPGGTVPTVTATNSAVDVLAYYVNSSTSITAKLLGDVK